jgi:hypothetical protein
MLEQQFSMDDFLKINDRQLWLLKVTILIVRARPSCDIQALQAYLGLM